MDDAQYRTLVHALNTATDADIEAAYRAYRAYQQKRHPLVTVSPAARHAAEAAPLKIEESPDGDQSGAYEGAYAASDTITVGPDIGTIPKVTVTNGPYPGWPPLYPLPKPDEGRGGVWAYTAAPDPIWTPPDRHQALRDEFIAAWFAQSESDGSANQHEWQICLHRWTAARDTLRAAIKPLKSVDPVDELRKAWDHHQTEQSPRSAAYVSERIAALEVKES